MPGIPLLRLPAPLKSSREKHLRGTLTRMRLAPSGRLVRFVALTTLVEVAAMIGGARWMIQPIRVDGGTWTEYLFFGVYAVVLLLGGLFLFNRVMLENVVQWQSAISPRAARRGR